MRILFFLFFLCTLHTSCAQNKGCTDPLANNFDGKAKINDGSCLYDPVLISPEASFDLDLAIHETSGLIYWQNKLWTQNDDSDNRIYALDTADGSVLSSVALTELKNVDWEEISQDDSFIYIGDFGNNVSGNRNDLKIYKISKESILNNHPIAETISFRYADQVDFQSQSGNHTDFDCEALIVTSDSIYLFTKQWIGAQTHLYVLPKIAGTHLAQVRDSLNVEGLITGATFLPSTQLLVLSGYSQLLEPFVYLLYDFKGKDFFSGNKRKIQLDLPFHQVEGITTKDGLKYYLTNEAFRFLTVSVKPKMHILDFKPFLYNYLYPGKADVNLKKNDNKFSVFPNPANETVRVSYTEKAKILLYDVMGRVLTVPMRQSSESSILDLRQIKAGIYLLGIQGKATEGNTLLIKR